MHASIRKKIECRPMTVLSSKKSLYAKLVQQLFSPLRSFLSSRKIHILSVRVGIGLSFVVANIISAHSPLSNEQFIKNLEQKISPSNDYSQIKTGFPWHTTFHSIGTRADPTSMYLPHRYTLTQLAPQKGNGITIVLIDTGVACFALHNTKQNNGEKKSSVRAMDGHTMDGHTRYVHPDLTYHYDRSHGCLSMIHMEPIYECTYTINELIGTPRLNSAMLEQWIFPSGERCERVAGKRSLARHS